MTLLTPVAAGFARYRLVDDGEVAAKHRDALWILLLVVLSWSTAPILGFRFALMVCTAFGYGLALLGSSNPRMAVFALGILATLDSASRLFLSTGGLYRFNTLNYCLILVSLLWGHRLVSRRDVPTMLFIGLTACVTAGLFFSPEPLQGVQHVFNLIAVPGMVVCLDRLPGRSDAWFWLGAINGAVGALGTTALFVFEVDRGNPNVWVYLPLSALLSTCLATLSDRRIRGGRLCLCVLAAANGALVLLSGSRGGFAVALCCLLYHVAAVSGFKRRAAAIVLLVLVSFGASQVFEVGRTSVARWRNLLDDDLTAAERTSGRSFLAQVGWHVFTEKPLGAGTGSYAHEGQPYGRAALAFSGSAMQAHSAWIKVLVENGVIGIILLGGYVASFAFVAFPRRDRALARLGILTSAVMAVAFLTTEFANKGLWLLPTGAAVLLAQPQLITGRIGGGTQ